MLKNFYKILITMVTLITIITICYKMLLYNNITNQIDFFTTSTESVLHLNIPDFGLMLDKPGYSESVCVVSSAGLLAVCGMRGGFGRSVKRTLEILAPPVAGGLTAEYVRKELYRQEKEAARESAQENHREHMDVLKQGKDKDRYDDLDKRVKALENNDTDDKVGAKPGADTGSLENVDPTTGKPKAPFVAPSAMEPGDNDNWCISDLNNYVCDFVNHFSKCVSLIDPASPKVLTALVSLIILVHMILTSIVFISVLRKLRIYILALAVKSKYYKPDTFFYVTITTLQSIVDWENRFLTPLTHFNIAFIVVVELFMLVSLVGAVQ